MLTVMDPVLRFYARLNSDPDRGAFRRADSLCLRPQSEREYELFALLAPADCKRALISRSQHYRLLGELVSDALRSFPFLTCVIVRFLEPNMLSIPLPLLDERVMLAHDVHAVLAMHEPRSADALILTIEDRFRRDNSELNDDSIDICLWGDCAAAAFRDYIRATRLYPALTDTRFSHLESEDSRVGA